MVDQIPGEPTILKGLDSKKFVQKPFPPSVAPKPIPKTFCMPEIPKYNGTTNPNERVTSYTCAIKGNNLEGDEIEYAHAGAIKVETRKSNFFKVRQKDNEMLREFVSRFQMERIDLPPVANDWAVQAFTQGLNIRSSVASQQLKQNLIEYPAVTWTDVHNRYQSKIRVEDDQLGAPPESIYHIISIDRTKRDINRETRSNMDRYQPYNGEYSGNKPGRNPMRNERRNDRGQSSRGFMSRNGFYRHTGPKEAPRLSGYNFNADASATVSAIGRIKDIKWPRPLQTDPVQRDPNQICKYHGVKFKGKTGGQIAITNAGLDPTREAGD
nr:uncharacterized protein LOC104090778 [Nicotiana tomentosiformis]